MNIIMKSIIVVSICLILISIVFSGCIFPSEFVIPPEGPSQHPDNPTVVVDSNENIHILWNSYHGREIFYMKIDKDMEIIIPRKIISKNITEWLTDPKVIVDSTNTIHVFSIDNEKGNRKIHYFQLDNNGNNKISDQIIGDLGYSDISTTSKIFNVVIDKKDFLHVIWLSKNSSEKFIAKYAMIDINGTIIVKKSISNFFGELSFKYNIIDISLSTTLNYEILHVIWQNGYNTLNVSTLEGGNLNETIRGENIRADNIGNLHINSGAIYLKLNYKGNIIVKMNLPEISISPDYPIIEDDEGNYLYLDDNGVIDSNKNLHLVTEKVETKVREGGRYYEEDFYTIYYSKIDSNGTILIDNMVIDSDGEPGWENDENNMNLILYPLLIAIPIVIIIFLFYLIYKQKKR